MIFSPGTLDHFANTFITSFYLPEAQKYLLNDWVKSYRGITVLEVDALLKQFKSILAQLTEAIDYLLYFALLAGFTVLFAAVRASLDQRLHEGALMRTLGAGRTFLRQTQFIEFALTGFCAGLLAVVLSESIIFALYRQVLELTYSPNPILWLVLPIGSAALVGLSGYWGVKEVANRAPLAVLREAE
jgi:putative ABC transport system permease protein